MVKKATIITGVIGADAHVIGNKILTYALDDSGFHTVNLGCLISQEEFINAAIETQADAILVSSLYGMAQLDCQGLRDKCEEAGLKGILLYIGGHLVMGQEDWQQTESTFREIGFDRVYPPGTLPNIAIADLENDLRNRSATSRP